jgi:hypothetical protein
MQHSLRYERACLANIQKFQIGSALTDLIQGAIVDILVEIAIINGDASQGTRMIASNIEYVGGIGYKECIKNQRM